MREFAQTMTRPFEVRYNPYTRNVEVIDNKSKLLSLAGNLRSELNTLTSAIQKLEINRIIDNHL